MSIETIFKLDDGFDFSCKWSTISYFINVYDISVIPEVYLIFMYSLIKIPSCHSTIVWHFPIVRKSTFFIYSQVICWQKVYIWYCWQPVPLLPLDFPGREIIALCNRLRIKIKKKLTTNGSKQYQYQMFINHSIFGIWLWLDSYQCLNSTLMAFFFTFQYSFKNMGSSHPHTL